MENFTTIGIPQFQGGFNLNFLLPITGEGVINRLDRTKLLISRDSLKAKNDKRFTSPAKQYINNKTNLLILLNLNNELQYKKAVNRNSEIAKLQVELYKGGYYDPRVTYAQAVDGIMGKATLKALLKRSNSQKNNKSKIVPLNLEQARTSYSRGESGLGDVTGSFIYHTIMPESMSMPHSEGLKDLLAAAVAYDLSSEGFKQKRPDGKSMIGYPTYGILSNSSLNINELKTSGNGASKIMGGVTYTIDDNKVHFDDKYRFGVYRTVDSDGKVHVHMDDNDPYKGNPWKGLVNDMSNINVLGILNIAENFGTRLGKSRDNSLIMSIDEINTRNAKNLKPITINTNYWNNYQDFK